MANLFDEGVPLGRRFPEFDPIATPNTISQSQFPGSEPPPFPSPVPLPTPQPNRLQQSLRYALPLLAAAYAAKTGGGFGNFTQGYLGAENIQQQHADRQAQIDLEKERVRREIAQYARAQAAEERRAADDAAKRVEDIQLTREKTMHDTLQRAIDRAATDPDFMKRVNEAGPENFTVPGMPGMNLRDAFEKLAVPRDESGEYYYGMTPTKTERTPLVTGVGPGGKPTRVKDEPGVTVWERPTPPKEPTKPTRRAYTWTDTSPDDPNYPYGTSYRIVEDENGNVISKQPITGGSTPPPAPAGTSGAKSKYRVGQQVKLKNGQTVTIKKINPDGTFDY